MFTFCHKSTDVPHTIQNPQGAAGAQIPDCIHDYMLGAINKKQSIGGGRVQYSARISLAMKWTVKMIQDLQKIYWQYLFELPFFIWGMKKLK